MTRLEAANDNRPIRYATMCSGIEGVSLAWEPLGGFQPVFFSEIAEFPKAVLAHHWRHVPDLGDLSKIDGRAWRGKVDVLWGSLPCQSFSTIGLRRGLADERGALSMKFVEVANDIDPEIIIIENAKGLLFNNDFDQLVCALSGASSSACAGNHSRLDGVQSGPHRNVAWRVLDAADFGLPQHRERLFVVAARTGRIDPAQLLALGESPRRDHSPSQQDRSGAAAPRDEGAWFLNGDTRPKVRFEQTATLRAEAGHAFVVQDGRVRRLLPVEWERLQGVNDNYTDIPWKGGKAPDTLRKRAVGNGLAVPVVRWIGERVIAGMADWQAAVNDNFAEANR